MLKTQVKIRGDIQSIDGGFIENRCSCYYNGNFRLKKYLLSHIMYIVSQYRIMQSELN